MTRPSWHVEPGGILCLGDAPCFKVRAVACEWGATPLELSDFLNRVIRLLNEDEPRERMMKVNAHRIVRSPARLA